MTYGEAYPGDGAKEPRIYEGRKIRIPHSIWRDPEFTKLSAGAQLLWFWLKMRPRPTKFRPERIAASTGWDLADVLAWASDLARSTYASEMTRTKCRQTITPEMRRYIYARDDYACRYCATGENLTIDHIHPIAHGGTDAISNLQTLCRSCNCRKGARI